MQKYVVVMVIAKASPLAIGMLVVDHGAIVDNLSTSYG